MTNSGRSHLKGDDAKLRYNAFRDEIKFQHAKNNFNHQVKNEGF